MIKEFIFCMFYVKFVEICMSNKNFFYIYELFISILSIV